jgi:hypothetical protein
VFQSNFFKFHYFLNFEECGKMCDFSKHDVFKHWWTVPPAAGGLCEGLGQGRENSKKDRKKH